jgi:hypothetical protein
MQSRRAGEAFCPEGPMNGKIAPETAVHLFKQLEKSLDLWFLNLVKGSKCSQWPTTVGRNQMTILQSRVPTPSNSTLKS